MTADASYLRYLAIRGAHERYGDYEGVVEERIEHELHVLETAGFPNYFLIVADLMRFCRDSDIPTGPGRGSVCGSAVAYATYITDVDPIRFGIPFERFLHLERVAQPDIDLDICQARRPEVIQYLYDTYGRDAVAQIITFTPMAAKGVVRDVCRVLHVDDVLRGVRSNETGERLAALIPDGNGADQVTLAEHMASDEGKKFGEELQSLVIPFAGEEISVADTCLTLEGLRRHSSVHAAGVVIADRPLIDVVPLYKKNKDAEIQIQYDMRDAETIGLLKLDVLGLRTVTVIGDAEKLVRQHNPNFRIKDVPLDDERAFALLRAGDTNAVFQLEGDGITAACTGMQPDRFEDIIALIALYRPGPMEQLGSYFRRKRGEEAIQYPHPALGAVLDRTYGLIVYQEQVMGIVRTLAGYTAGEADMFRKAIGKKLVDLIQKEIDGFIERAVGLGHDRKAMEAIGKQIFDFGRYGFNLGHATGYGFITYWTAYLKANHPAEFYCATLNSYIGEISRISGLIADARKHDIDVVGPDINRSGVGFTVDYEFNEQEGDIMPIIRFGLGGVKGLGETMVEDILDERDSTTKRSYVSQRVNKVREDGSEFTGSVRVVQRVAHEPRPFDGPYDFCRRLPSVTTTVKKALAVAGAFGYGSEYRRRLVAAMEALNKAAKSNKPFDLEGVTAQMSEIELMREERRVLGFYIGENPLSFYRPLIDRYGAISTGTLGDLPTNCVVAGIVTAIRTHSTPKGEMAWLTLENEIEDLPDITVFASLWGDLKHHIKKEDVVVVRGKKENHPKFGWGIKSELVTKLDAARPEAESITIVGIEDAIEIDGLAGLAVESGGMRLNVVVRDAERFVLVNTSTRVGIDGADLQSLEDSGYRVVLDYDYTKPLVWPGPLYIHPSKRTHAGFGEDRAATWDLPLVKHSLNTLGRGNRAPTEMEP